MAENTVHLCVQKIRDGKRKELEHYLRENFAEEDELKSILAEVGIRTESVFTMTIGGDAYLLFYIDANNLKEILEDWRTGKDEELEYQREMVEQTLKGGAEEYLQNEANLIFHVQSDVN